MGVVAVIGAGSAGLVTAQALASRGIPHIVYEAGSDVGGTWRYDNDSGRSSAYASLRTNTSAARTSFRALRIGGRPDAFLTHREMLRYLERFTEHFALRPRIQFDAVVDDARRATDGSWELTINPREGERRTVRHRAVIVATGFNSVPRLPDLPGSFDGITMHSHDYRTPEPFTGLDTVVIGMGSSSCELACELRHHARSVTLAARSGSDVTARRVGPVPIDWFDSRASSVLPWSLRRRTFGPLIKLAAGGTPARHGLPSAPERVGDRPIAVSDDLVRALRRGEVRASAPVVALAGDRVVVQGGSELPAGAILFGTGYYADFPFLPADVEPPSHERAALYRGVASPVAPGLFFVGLVGANGALMPLMEAQANWVAESLGGRLNLPPADQMLASIAADDVVRQRDFRHAPGVWRDRLRYCRALEAEARRARRRPGAPRNAAAPTTP